MYCSLNKKKVIITGGSGDIGKALMQRFLDEGCLVASFDKKTGQDITNSAVLKKHIDTLGKEHGTIDILINNAGITGKDIPDEEKTQRMIATNLIAPLNLTNYVVPYMKKNGGSIINITSLWSELGGENNPLYGMTKGGLKTLTKCLAYDLAEFNIRVNNVGFGYIKTSMTSRSWENKIRRREIAKRTMLGRWGEPKDVCGVVAFLCSDEAEYITGQDYYVDGGFLAKGI